MQSNDLIVQLIAIARNFSMRFLAHSAQLA